MATEVFELEEIDSPVGILNATASMPSMPLRLAVCVLDQKFSVKVKQTRIKKKAFNCCLFFSYPTIFIWYISCFLKKKYHFLKVGKSQKVFGPKKQAKGFNLKVKSKVKHLGLVIWFGLFENGDQIEKTFWDFPTFITIKTLFERSNKGIVVRTKILKVNQIWCQNSRWSNCGWTK